MLSKRRSLSSARPRQVAMALAKELTNHSLPEIGEAFGGGDHTTVLHACRKIKQMQEEDPDIREEDRKSTRLNSSHVAISYAVFCLKKKKNQLIYNIKDVK